MDIRIGWDNSERTTLRQTFEGRWTWNDFETATAALFKMIDGLAHPVDLILEINAPAQLSPEDTWRDARFVVRELPRQTRTIVIVDRADMSMPFVLLYQLYGANERLMMLANTLDEARATIARREAKYKAQTQPQAERTTAVMPVLKSS